MIYGKEECKNLVACRAAVLVCDGYTENGTPVIVVRRVVGCGAVRSGRNSNWFVNLDTNLSDECNGVCFHLLLGVHAGNSLDVSGLIRYIDAQRHLPFHERQMLISDATTRLQEAYK